MFFSLPRFYPTFPLSCVWNSAMFSVMFYKLRTCSGNTESADFLLKCLLVTSHTLYFTIEVYCSWFILLKALIHGQISLIKLIWHIFWIKNCSIKFHVYTIKSVGSKLTKSVSKNGGPFRVIDIIQPRSSLLVF